MTSGIEGSEAEVAAAAGATGGAACGTVSDRGVLAGDGAGAAGFGAGFGLRREQPAIANATTAIATVRWRSMR